MTNNKKLEKKLTTDVKKLENKIKYKKIYNVRNFFIRSLLKIGIALDYTFPFILAAVIIANLQASKGKKPFRINEITENASIETIDTSSGVHLEHISYDFNYDKELIEHSTGWYVNDKGLYERIITSYRLSDEINLEETEKITAMTKEELEQILVITNVRTIKKNALTPEDYIYNEDAIIIINHLESQTESITRLETKNENVWGTIIYISLTLLMGIGCKSLKKVFVKRCFRDKLKEYEPMLRHINKEELKILRDILKVKQENLALITGKATQVEEPKAYSRSLRRKQGG